jgi:hypothetical protein
LVACLVVITHILGVFIFQIQLIMKCTNSISYFILINGEPHGRITPTRGILQGDLLSPYLFILYAKAISSMLQKAERMGSFTGVPIARGHVCLNYLFFANDSRVFCEESLVEWSHVQHILDSYEKASGQRLNKEKTSIFFIISLNTKAEITSQILYVSGLKATQCATRQTMLENSKEL